MKFEFNQRKSEANRGKHGISLEKAATIWEQARVEVTARTVGEPRGMVIGKIKGKLYACIYTAREEAIQIVLCRRASKREVRLYNEHFKEAYEETDNDDRGV